LLSAVAVSVWWLAGCWLVFCGAVLHSLWCASMLVRVRIGMTYLCWFDEEGLAVFEWLLLNRLSSHDAARRRRMNTRMIALVITMAVLGNVLSLIPIGLTRVGQVGFDFSLVTTLIVALYGGPVLGFLTGLAGGVSAGVLFGPMGQLSWLGLVGLPIGKSLTGLTAGVLFKGLRIRERMHPSPFAVPIVLLAYVPEFLFTVFFFLALVPYFFGWVSVPLVISIGIKAWMELGVMSVLVGALLGNNGFSEFMSAYFSFHRMK